MNGSALHIRTLRAKISCYLCAIIALIIQDFRCLAQDIVNGDFSIWHGVESSVSSCPYFKGSNVPNWFPTGGTPQWIYPGSIQMWGGHILTLGSGESFAGNYHFQPGVKYTIRVGMEFWDMSDLGCSTGDNTQLNIWAANGLIESTPGSCGAGLQSVPYTIIKTQIQNTAFTASSNVVFQMTFNPTTAYNQIWIFPHTDCAGGITTRINYVNISNCTNGEIDYRLTSELIGGGSTQVGSIIAGSGLPTSVVLVDPNASTLFVGEKVELVQNLKSKPNEGKYFLVTPGGCIDTGEVIKINGGPCDILPQTVKSEYCMGTLGGLPVGLPPGGVWISTNPSIAFVTASGGLSIIAPGTTILSYIRGACTIMADTIVISNCEYNEGKTSVSDSQGIHSFSVYPNPTNNKIDISGEISQPATLTINDVSGRTLTMRVVQPGQTRYFRETIDLSNANPGIYFVKITSSEATRVVKIIKLQ